MAVPTILTCQMLVHVAQDPFQPNAKLGTYMNFVNLPGLCALAVPPRFRDGYGASGSAWSCRIATPPLSERRMASYVTGKERRAR